MSSCPQFVMVGNITLDWILTAGGDVRLKACGGNTLYAAAGARLWTDSIGIVSRVGNDFPCVFLDDFARIGIDLQGIRTLEEPHELVVAYRYDEGGKRHDFNPLEVFASRQPEAEIVREDHILFHQDSYSAEVAFHFDPLLEDIPNEYWKAHGFHIGGMRHASHSRFIAAFSASNIPFTYDPGGLDQPKAERQKILQQTRYVLPSLEEMKWLVDSNQPEQAAREIACMGPAVVVIKMGSRGCLVYDRNREHLTLIPAVPVVVQDPTGAGDAFCGGFLVGIVETGNPVEAALRATVSSSFVIEGFDARYSFSITRQQVEHRYSQLRKSIQEGWSV